MDWAKHRRRKAAAKCHLRLDLQTFLPRFAIVDTARDNDNKRAREVCAGIKDGEIVIFDKAYVDFEHLWDLAAAGINWVTRAKENMQFRVVKRRKNPADPRVLRDEIIVAKVAKTHASYPGQMRRVVALVEIDGREVEMTFLTNNLEWSARSVADLYRCRWSIEVFFKQIKQTLQLSDFLGHSANAVRWQIWSALLVYVLLRYLAFIADWSHSFTRLFTMVRSVLWRKIDLLRLLQGYGTAGGNFRILGTPQAAYFPGF
jgi:IS4 transposase